MAITVPAEISAAATLIQFWNTSINPGVWVTIFLVFVIVVNFCGVRLYGESEVVFASLKIMLIVGLIIGVLVFDLGGAPNQERLGFHYWKEPSAFNEYIDTGAAGRFLAFWKVMLTAAFGYGNIQVVANSGSETRDPRSMIPSATKMTFYRVLLFYVLSIFIVGLIVPYGDKSLNISTGTAQQFPFVIAFQRSGVSTLLSIINAVDLSCALLPLVYLNVANNTSVVFGWFVNITTAAGLVGGVVIEATYLRFYAGLKAQGYSREDLPYKSPLQPYVAWATLVAVLLVIIFSGFDVFVKGHFTAAGFLTCYLDIGIFAALYIFSKLLLRSKVVKVSGMDFRPEFSSIQVWREKTAMHQGKRTWYTAIIRSVGGFRRG